MISRDRTVSLERVTRRNARSATIIAAQAARLILGHVSDVRGRYGRKGILDPLIAAKIEALEPPVIKQMREILLAAKNRVDAGGLSLLKTY
jgi:hypothetical protein